MPGNKPIACYKKKRRGFMGVPSWNKEKTTQNLVEPTEESIDFDVTTENIPVPVTPSSSSNVLSSSPISYTSVAKRKLEFIFYFRL